MDSCQLYECMSITKIIWVDSPWKNHKKTCAFNNRTKAKTPPIKKTPTQIKANSPLTWHEAIGIWCENDIIAEPKPRIICKNNNIVRSKYKKNAFSTMHINLSCDIFWLLKSHCRWDLHFKFNIRERTTEREIKWNNSMKLVSITSEPRVPGLNSN